MAHKIKVIKNEEDYDDALANVEELMDLNPDPDSDQGEQLAVLSKLIEDYESNSFPATLNDPIEAIKFRMDQAGLKQIDLAKYIGSRSKVSEVLSGKRPLTLEMVRKLADGLGIPAKSLIKKPDVDASASNYQYWGASLLKEMEDRGYFGKYSLKKYDKRALLDRFFSDVLQSPTGIMLRQSHRSGSGTDKYALVAWSIRLFKRAEKVKNVPKYKKNEITLEFMRELAKLSTEEDGPIRAQKDLMKKGVILLIEPHLSKTRLDGAVILSEKENPLIGITLRYNRIDNFWFTLMHELAHVSKHYDQGISIFYDEDVEEKKTEDQSKELEKEADKLAREALVPLSKWNSSPASILPSPVAAEALANELKIHKSIVAGFIRHEQKNWYYLKNFVKDADVRKLFPKLKWKNEKKN